MTHNHFSEVSSLVNHYSGFPCAQYIPASVMCRLFKDSFAVTVGELTRCRSVVTLSVRVGQA